MGRSLKIALVLPTFSTLGGRERYVSNLADGLLRRGHEVHLFCAKVRGEVPKGLNVHRVFRLNLDSLTKTLTFALSAQRAIRRAPFDVVQGFGDIAKQDVLRLGGGCHREFRKMVLLAPEAPLGKRIATRLSPLQWVLLALESARLKKGNYLRLIVNSKMVRDQIRRHFDIDDDALRVVYNGVDAGRFSRERFEGTRTELRRSLGLDDGNLAVLFLGSGFWLKGLDTLLRVLPTVAREVSAVRLLVAGRDRHVGFYEWLARKLGIESRVRFLGASSEPERLYAACDLYVLPSRYDASANTILEAMASSLPCITSSANGAKEFIGEGAEGFVLENPINGEGLASLILRCTPEEKRSAMGERARRKALSYSIDRNVDETLDVYAEAMEVKRARARG